jgi:hypothetical protein
MRGPKVLWLMTDAVDIAFYVIMTMGGITLVAAAWLLLRRP